MGEGELGVEIAPGQALGPVGVVAELAGVGHPLVDEHHGRPEPPEQLPQCRAGVGAGLVVAPNQLVTLEPAELIGQMAPQRVQSDAAAAGQRGGRGDGLAHQHGPGDLWGQGQVLLGQQLAHAGQVAGGRARGQVVQGDEAMGLAAAEVGLQLDHRVAALARQPPGRGGQQVPQALGEIGAGEEGPWVLVLGVGPALSHRVQVGGELGLVEAPGPHVGVGDDDVAPRRQPGLGGALGGAGRDLAVLGARLGLEHLAQQVAAEVAHGLALVEVAEGFQQALHGVEGPAGVVAGEPALVGPVVAGLSDLEHQGPHGWGEPVAEHLVPSGQHAVEQEGQVLGVGVAGRAPEPPVDRVEPALAEEPGPGLDAFGPQPVPQQVQAFGDALVVGQGHGLAPLGVMAGEWPPSPVFVRAIGSPVSFALGSSQDQPLGIVCCWPPSRGWAVRTGQATMRAL